MAKKKAGSGAPMPKSSAAPLTEIEQQAQAMLDDNDEGNIDNVFDVIDDLMSIEEELPKSSRLRPAWDAFYASCIEIIEDSAKA
jgi:hypothetical protein